MASRQVLVSLTQNSDVELLRSRPLVNVAHTSCCVFALSAPRPCHQRSTGLVLPLSSLLAEDLLSWAPIFLDGRKGSQTPMPLRMTFICKMIISNIFYKVGIRYYVSETSLSHHRPLKACFPWQMGVMGKQENFLYPSKFFWLIIKST